MIHIAFCSDSNYVMPLGVALISICENNRDEDIMFHLVVTDDGKSSKESSIKIKPLQDITNKYKNKSKVYYIRQEQLSNFVCEGASYVSTTAFSRIFLPEILPSDVHKVLYLDCDLVCLGSIRDLWEFELTDAFPIGAVIDAIGTSPTVRRNIQTPLTVQYCNSGVLLMNLDCWRKEGLSAKISECANKMKFPLLDQDTLNYFFKDRIKLLPIIYNLQTNFLYRKESHWMIDYIYFDEVKSAIKNPCIVHYVGGNKPWKDEYCPMKDVWRRYFKLSIWADRPEQNHIGTFEESFIFQKEQAVYWSDPELFKIGINHMCDFLSVAVRIKHKHLLLNVMCRCLSVVTNIVDYHFIRVNRKAKK